METRGIIITGTSASGKSFVGYKFIEKHIQFKIVKAYTTRLKRANDDPHYDYISKIDYAKFADSDKFVSTKYGDNYYCILNKDVDDIIALKKIPVLIVSPESYSKLDLENKNLLYLSVFFDADDITLDTRLRLRGLVTKEIEEQRITDRKFSRDCTYKLINSILDIGDILKFINKIWLFHQNSGVLSQDLIACSIKCNVLLANAINENVSKASYDLRLGEEYYYKGKVNYLSKQNPFILIDSYDYAIVTCHEIANLPNNVVARFGLTVSLFCQGLILSNGPQIDPGFHGKLFCVLFNTSNRPIVLKTKQHYATIEFTKLIESTDGYDGKYQDKIDIINYLPANTLQGALSELKKEIEKLSNESKLLQTVFYGVISMVLAIIALLLAFR